MRCAHRSYLPGLVVLLLLLGFVAPQAAAQDIPPEQPCPEGLVYYEPGDICLLPEDIPSDQEEGDQPADEAQQSTEEPVVDEQQSVEDEQIDDETQPANDEQQPALDQEQAAGDPNAQIKNLTLLTFACPVNWDPATRPIEASREMCTEPIVANMTYTVLFEGEELVSATLGVPIDLAETFGASGPGMYTIRETVQEGLDEPVRLLRDLRRRRHEAPDRGGNGARRIARHPAGRRRRGQLRVVQRGHRARVSAPAAPALGLDLKVFSCPAPAEFNGGLDECTLPLPGPISFEFSYGGQVLETGTVSPPELTYEVSTRMTPCPASGRSGRSCRKGGSILTSPARTVTLPAAPTSAKSRSSHRPTAAWASRSG